MASDQPILIAGPTASGKSALALGLAERLGGVVINADSMQVYSELRVLTARPTPADEARAPHALYGFVPAREAYSTGRYVTDVVRALADAREMGQRPIIVGGTGLYFKALLDGLSPIPAIPDDMRIHWRGQATELGAAALWAMLRDIDPEMAARLEPNDSQRIVRALEVYSSTGRSLAEWQRTPGTPLIRADDAVRLVVLPDRATLRARVDARFEQMVADGAVAEAAALGALQLDADLPAMRAIGVAAMIGAAAGSLSMADAIQLGQAESRQYVKRQETWLRRNMIAWNNVYAQHSEQSLALAFSFIQS